MRNRKKLNDLFIEILGSSNVYFSPPENVKMKYPAIIYKLDDVEKTYANNKVYALIFTYNVTVVDKTQDSAIVEKMLELTGCKFDRAYSVDGLYHNIFTISEQNILGG